VKTLNFTNFLFLILANNDIISTTSAAESSHELENVQETGEIKLTVEMEVDSQAVTDAGKDEEAIDLEDGHSLLDTSYDSDSDSSSEDEATMPSAPKLAQKRGLTEPSEKFVFMPQMIDISKPLYSEPAPKSPPTHGKNMEFDEMGNPIFETYSAGKYEKLGVHTPNAVTVHIHRRLHMESKEKGRQGHVLSPYSTEHCHQR